MTIHPSINRPEVHTSDSIFSQAVAWTDPALQR